MCCGRKEAGLGVPGGDRRGTQAGATGSRKSALKGGNERHDGAPRGLVMPLQKGGVLAQGKEGDGRGPRNTSCSFPDQVTAPNQEGADSTRRVGTLPGDRR